MATAAVIASMSQQPRARIVFLMCLSSIRAGARPHASGGIAVQRACRAESRAAPVGLLRAVAAEGNPLRRSVLAGYCRSLLVARGRRRHRRGRDGTVESKGMVVGSEYMHDT